MKSIYDTCLPMMIWIHVIICCSTQVVVVVEEDKVNVLKKYARACIPVVPILFSEYVLFSGDCEFYL